jgi:pimeloyl-ACP methyl ester carboxylesterase
MLESTTQTTGKTELASRYVDADGLRLHYLEAGEGAPVLLLHGWPTSSFLWRNVMPYLAPRRRVIALDLPGFGRSAKPLDASYGFGFYQRTLDGFLRALAIDRVGLAVHDLGGPIGPYRTSKHPERLVRLAILNTVVYPELSWAVAAFVAASRLPGVRDVLASPWGLEKALHLGVHDRRRLRHDALDGLKAPFADRDARKALLRAGSRLGPKGLQEIARWLPTIDVPVRVIYGAQDRILPDIADTVRRLKADVPRAEITRLDDCGHFLQEERPDEVGRLLAAFFTGA